MSQKYSQFSASHTHTRARRGRETREKKAHSRPRARTNIILVINARKSHMWSKQKSAALFALQKLYLNSCTHTHDCYTFIKYEFRDAKFGEHSFRTAKAHHAFKSKILLINLCKILNLFMRFCQSITLPLDWRRGTVWRGDSLEKI